MIEDDIIIDEQNLQAMKKTNNYSNEDVDMVINNYLLKLIELRTK
jgi:hypothetical protein